VIFFSGCADCFSEIGDLAGEGVHQCFVVGFPGPLLQKLELEASVGQGLP